MDMTMVAVVAVLLISVSSLILTKKNQKKDDK